MASVARQSDLTDFIRLTAVIGTGNDILAHDHARLAKAEHREIHVQPSDAESIHPMLKSLARTLLKHLGWTLIEPSERPARAVLVGYPHTSNWDGVIALLTKLALGLDAHWVGKDSLFRWPLGGIFRRLGGIPIDRSARNGFVANMAAQFAIRPEFLLVIAPEGTRSLTKGWKSGFYRIALAANVPVALAFVDYPRRQAGILTYLTMTGDPATDIAAIAAHYEGRQGKHPALASPIRWLD